MKNNLKLTFIVVSLLIALNSFSQKSLVTKAQNLCDRGSVEKAYSTILITTDPNEPKAKFTATWPKAWEVKGEICQKIFETKEPILNDPLQVAMDSYLKAVSYDESGKYLKSIRIKLLLLTNDFVNQAVVQFGAEKYNEALASFEAILKIGSFDFMKDGQSSVDTVIIFNAGLAALNAENWDKAIQFFGEASKYGYNKEKPFALLARSYKEIGDMEGYNRTVAECIAKYPYSKSLFGQSFKYEYTIKTTTGDQLMVHEENEIKIEFDIQDNSIDFKLKNLSTKPIKIVWDNTSIVVYEEAHRVIHKGVKYTDKASSQAETLVPPKASISDLVIPIDNINWAKNSNDWVTTSLFPTNDKSDEQLAEMIQMLKGSSISLFMPIIRGDEEVNVYVEFIITDVIKL